MWKNSVSKWKWQSGISTMTLLVIVAFVLAYAGTLVMFMKEGHPSWMETGETPQSIPVVAHVIAVDLIRDTVTYTFVPEIKSAAVASDRRLKMDIDMFVDTGGSALKHKFKKGEVPIPWIVTVPIEDGDLLEYPVDRHQGEFTIRASIEGGENVVPKVDLDQVVHGWQLTAKGQPSTDKGLLEVSFKIQRSPSVILLAFMAMISLTLIVCSALVVAWHVAVRGRKVEFGMMVWLAAMLFVVPAVRNGLPGSPPPGALIDFALFFWLHLLAVIALLMLVRTWHKEGKKT